MRGIFLGFAWTALLGWPLTALSDAPRTEYGHSGCYLIRDKSSLNFVVEWVVPKSPADLAGLRSGDLVVAVEGEPSAKLRVTDVARMLTGPIGSTVPLTVAHPDGTKIDVLVQLKSRFDAYGPGAELGDMHAEAEMGYYCDHLQLPHQTNAFDWYKKSADQNFAPAQAAVGEKLIYGLGTTKDVAGGVQYLQEAAKQGDAFGEAQLALCYMYGRGVERSDQEAYAWFYAAGVQGDAVAARNLGYCYRDGRAVPRDYVEAAKWFRLAAEKHDGLSALALAVMYRHGQGVPRDLAKSLDWYEKAETLMPNNTLARNAAELARISYFLETGNSDRADLPRIMKVFRPYIVGMFMFAFEVYLACGALLLVFRTLHANEPPGFLGAVGWIVFYVESQVVAILAMFVFGNSLRPDLMMVCLMVFGALPVIASTYSNRRHVWRRPALSVLGTIFCAVGCFIALFVATEGAMQFFSWTTHTPITPQPTEAFFAKSKQASVWIALSTIALALPAAEEVVFRSYLYDACRRRLSVTWTILITALVFALIHLQGLYTIPLFGMGLVLGYARYKSNSLWLPLFIHGVNNGLIVLLMM